jgi:hypothetical protein
MVSGPSNTSRTAWEMLMKKLKVKGVNGNVET